MTGPKIAPIASVPRRWIANSPMSIAMVSGTTNGEKAGVAIESPSIALSTEIAGVIMPSP